MSSTNPHNTTSGDNSSDSASNKKNMNCRTELEIIELKLKKCTNEIEGMKKKVQREWSLQMNNHLKNFYPAEENDKSDLFSSPISQTPGNHNTESPADIEKQIHLLQKKLSSYERRKQKLIHEQSKANESQEPAEQLNNETNSNGNNNNNTANTNESVSNLSNNSSTITTSSGANTTINSSAINAVDNPNSLQNSNNNQQMPRDLALSVTNRNQSFTNNGKLEFLASFQTELTNNHNLNEESSRSTSTQDSGGVYGAQNNFGLGSSMAGNILPTSVVNGNNSTLKNANATAQPSSSNLNYNNNGMNSATYEELLNSNADILATNKSLQNMIYYLKVQQENIQSNLEDMQKKQEENHQGLLKELQHSYSQISEPIHKLSFNLYKSYDQKLDDFKSASLTSMQSLGYNLTHYQRDIKEIKEDTIFIKNRVEIIEKSQKPDDGAKITFYHGFYKFLDVLLVIFTAFLLGLTKSIESIRYIFLMIPRPIVTFVFLWSFFYYVVGMEKLTYLYYTVFNEHENTQSSSVLGGESLHETIFKKTWIALFRAFDSSDSTVKLKTSSVEI